MSEQDIFDLALARSAWRSMVTVRLGAGNARLSWSKTPLPVLLNVTELAHASAFAGVDRGRILLADSEPTALERADGNWGPAARRLGAPGGGAGATVTSLAAEFDRHLAPSIRQPRTRADYWRAWRLVVTWAVARKAVKDILSMKMDTLKALFFLFLNVDMVLKEYVCSTGNKAAFAAAMNMKQNDPNLDKMHAWSMVGTRPVQAAKARGFFKALHDRVIKSWMQDERLTPTDLVGMVKDEYLVA
jgi:hypothetical protein